MERTSSSWTCSVWWIVRTRTDPRTLTTSISGTLREASVGLPVAHIRTLEAGNVAHQRLNLLLLTVFGVAGLLIAAIGVYGVMAYSIQQRTQELGVRIALGAQASDLRNMVIRQGITLTLVGAVIGIGVALWLTRFLASFLFGVKPLDRISFMAAPLVLFAVSSSRFGGQRSELRESIQALHCGLMS